ncbi:MAG: adenylate/guanylate cyclase domain-containing protein [Dehalococcoidia bacterium]
MEPRIQYTTAVDGVSIAFYDAGASVPVVFVSDALPFSHIQAEAQHPEEHAMYDGLARAHRIVRYDCRGAGSSDRGVVDFSLDAYVSDLEAVADRAGLEHFALYGAWAGGPVAITYAARHPERVSHLVLCHSYARAEEAMRTPEMTAIRGLLDTSWEIFTESIAHALILGWSEGELAHELALFLREGMAHETARVAFPAVGAFDASDALERVQAPTLILWSQDVPWPPNELSRAMAARIPGARLMALGDRASDRYGYGPMWDAIDDFIGIRRAGATSYGEPMAASEFVTILFTDIEGSTNLTQRYGDARAQDLLRAHNTIVREALRARGGNETKHTGDGIMASFPSASRAIESAIAIQQAVASYNEHHPNLPLGVRIGLNAGEPVAEEHDLFGTAVQLARRVCDRAEPGQILVPEGVRYLVAGKGYLFADEGVVSLKGFEDPVRLYGVRWQEHGSA